MSSCEPLSPRSAKTTRAASRMRWRLRSASRRRGRSEGRADFGMERIVAEVESFSPIGEPRSTCVLQCRWKLRPTLHLSLGSPAYDRHRPFNSKRRWLILALIGLAQLMVVLDVTIVN